MRDAGKGEKNRIRLYAMREKKQSVDNLIWLAIAMEKKAKKTTHGFTSESSQIHLIGKPIHHKIQS